MTILFDVDIIAAVERGDIAITDFDDSEEGPLGTNSYDVRVGGLFLEVLWTEEGPWFVRQPLVVEGQRVAVPVGGTLLAMTMERITTRGRITGIMKSRSSIGKVGITVCKCAGLGDVGYDNHWTMELTAFTLAGQPWVTVGERIAQISFFEGESEPRKPYSGQYRIEDWPLCMVPKDYRGHIVDRVEHIPDRLRQCVAPTHQGGKIS